jgi:hypothetical protein
MWNLSLRSLSNTSVIYMKRKRIPFQLCYAPIPNQHIAKNKRTNSTSKGVDLPVFGVNHDVVTVVTGGHVPLHLGPARPSIRRMRSFPRGQKVKVTVEMSVQANVDIEEVEVCRVEEEL